MSPAIVQPDNEDWRALNLANWDERVSVHLGPGSDYDLGPLRAGQGRLNVIDEAELGPVAGLRVCHLQCHFGKDTLVLAQRGAAVTGVDFSGPAILKAQELAAELGLDARFAQGDVYDAVAVAGTGFDLVYTTWGTVTWLPDIAGWAHVVAGLLRPGGSLYFADAHPAALVFDDKLGPGGQPHLFAPYFGGKAITVDDPRDYADPHARIANARTVQWMHPLGAILDGLRLAGLRLDWLREHPRVPWQMFDGLVTEGNGSWTWPDQPWLPLALSLRATLATA